MVTQGYKSTYLLYQPTHVTSIVHQCFLYVPSHYFNYHIICRDLPPKGCCTNKSSAKVFDEFVKDSM